MSELVGSIHVNDVLTAGPDFGCLPITVGEKFKRELSDHTVRMVFVVVAKHANEKNESWPSLDTLARESGLARRKVQVGLRVLEENGYILKVGEHIPRRRGTVYRLLTPSVRSIEFQIEESREINPVQATRRYTRKDKSNRTHLSPDSSTHKSTHLYTGSSTGACNKEEDKEEKELASRRSNEALMMRATEIVEQFGKEVQVGVKSLVIDLAISEGPERILTRLRESLEIARDLGEEMDVLRWLKKQKKISDFS